MWTEPREAHLPLMQNVPEQWQVLCGEVPKRLDAPAMADGDQVEVIELCRDRRGELGSAGGQSRRLTILELPPGKSGSTFTPRPAGPAAANPRDTVAGPNPGKVGVHLLRVSEGSVREEACVYSSRSKISHESIYILTADGEVGGQKWGGSRKCHEPLLWSNHMC